MFFHKISRGYNENLWHEFRTLIPQTSLPWERQLKYLSLIFFVLFMIGCEEELKNPESGVPYGGESYVSFKDIPYKTTEQRELKLDLTHPEVIQGEPRVGIILIHGGAWLFGDKGHKDERQVLASHGYVAASIQYRLTGEGVGYKEMVSDCKCAIQWMKAHSAEYNIDPNKIFLWGQSAGGHLALLSGLSKEEDIPTGDCEWDGGDDRKNNVIGIVNSFGPTHIPELLDWAHDEDNELIYNSSVLMVNSNNLSEYNMASPIIHLDKSDPPIITIHGTDDNVVDYDQAEILDYWAVAAGVPHRLEPINGAGHGFKDKNELTHRRYVFEFIQSLTWK